MAISDVSDEEIRKILSEHLTPSDTIKTPDRLYGREKNLLAIDRALNSAGRQVFIYGDRGVGKTSLALTSARMHTHPDCEPVYVVCGAASTFANTIQAIGNSTIDIQKRLEKPASGRALNFSVPLLATIGISEGNPKTISIPEPNTINEALDIIRFVASKKSGKVVIVVDELERLESHAERLKLSEFIKNLPELRENVRFIFCGIASDIDELLASHPSAGRILEAIQLDRLHHSDRWKIITTVSELLGITVDREFLIRISQISDGFPHYVHLIGEAMFWDMFDDPNTISECNLAHFRAGIRGAIERTHAVLRNQYDKATMKTRNTEDYEEALWSLADGTSDRRQVTEIYDSSYRPMMLKRTGRNPLVRELFNQRLLSLKRESHGKIVVGYGSGWFGLRENMVRGYVRLRAQEKGIELGHID